MVRGTNYYTLLGVNPRASQKEIKAAYHRLARRYHPDVNPGNMAAEELLKQFNAAYEVLSDPDKRARYNRLEFGDWAEPQRPPPRPEPDPTWRPGAAPAASQTADLRYSVEAMNQFVFSRLRQQLGRERIVWELYEWAGIDWLQAVGFVRYAEIIYRCEIVRRRRAFTRLTFYGSVGLGGILLNLLLGIVAVNFSGSFDGLVWIAGLASSVMVGGSLIGFLRTLAMVR